MKTPDGKNGTTDASGIYDGYEQLEELGRGLAKIRPTNYAQYSLWSNCVMICVITLITGLINHVSLTICRLQRVAVLLISANR